MNTMIYGTFLRLSENGLQSNILVTWLILPVSQGSSQIFHSSILYFLPTEKVIHIRQTRNGHTGRGRSKIRSIKDRFHNVSQIHVFVFEPNLLH